MLQYSQVKGLSLGLAFILAAISRSQTIGFSVVVGKSRVIIVLKLSCWAVPSPWTRENKASLRFFFFFLSALIGISGLLASSVPDLIHMR